MQGGVIGSEGRRAESGREEGKSEVRQGD